MIHFRIKFHLPSSNERINELVTAMKTGACNGTKFLTSFPKIGQLVQTNTHR